MRRLAYLVALASVALAGCETTRFAEPPADRLVCPDEPAIPPDPITDQKNAEYLKEMRGSWAECKADVDWLRAWFRKLNS
jgi:hypothetical protein